MDASDYRVQLLTHAAATERGLEFHGKLGVNPYKVGQIGRGVLKRAKDSLDNVKANITGIILNNVRHPRVSWYDPNFGVNFNSIMETIESVVPSGNIDFIGILGFYNSAVTKKASKR